jgi:hypothetical protein
LSRERAGRIVKRQDRQTDKKEGVQVASKKRQARRPGQARKKVAWQAKRRKADAYKEHTAHWQKDKRQAAGIKRKDKEER